MDCPPNILNYVNLPTNIQNYNAFVNNKFVAVGSHRTIFFCDKGYFYRFDNVRNLALLMDGKITAFVDSNLNIKSSLHPTPLRLSYVEPFLKIYSNRKTLDNTIFCNIENIEINIDNYGLIKMVPDILPVNLVYHSAYYDENSDIEAIQASKIFFPHDFYNSVINKYGYVNNLTLLVFFICMNTPVKTINITISADADADNEHAILQVFDIYDKCKLIFDKLTADTINLMLKRSYSAYASKFNIEYNPQISMPDGILSFPDVTTPVDPSGYYSLCICCHIKNINECNELTLRLLAMKKQINYKLIITVNDMIVKNILSKTFIDATILIIPSNGYDIGGFLQSLNNIYSNNKVYKYIMKMHFNDSYYMREHSLNLLQNITDITTYLDNNLNMNMIGAPLIKFDLMHTNYIIKYVNRYRFNTNMPIIYLNKLITTQNEACKHSAVFLKLLRTTTEQFIPSCNFICRFNKFNEKMVDSYGDLVNLPIHKLYDNYNMQYAELAWIRLFGIIAGTLEDKIK